jgi:hypothetical protein
MRSAEQQLLEAATTRLPQRPQHSTPQQQQQQQLELELEEMLQRQRRARLWPVARSALACGS